MGLLSEMWRSPSIFFWTVCVLSLWRMVLKRTSWVYVQPKCRSPASRIREAACMLRLAAAVQDMPSEVPGSERKSIRLNGMRKYTYHNGYSSMLWHMLTVRVQSRKSEAGVPGRFSSPAIPVISVTATKSVPLIPVSARSWRMMLCEWVNRTLRILLLRLCCSALSRKVCCAKLFQPCPNSGADRNAAMALFHSIWRNEPEKLLLPMRSTAVS